MCSCRKSRWGAGRLFPNRSASYADEAVVAEVAALLNKAEVLLLVGAGVVEFYGCGSDREVVIRLRCRGLHVGEDWAYWRPRTRSTGYIT
jgi:hypothetical protein